MKVLGILVAVAVLAGSAAAQQADEFSKSMLKELKAMRSAQEELNASLTRIEKKLADEAADDEDDATPVAAIDDNDERPWDAETEKRLKERGVDVKKLAELELPEHPTTDQAKEYIVAILATSRHQNSWGSDDPQVEMLARVGHENLRMLVNFSGVGNDFYVRYAIDKLVDERDKDLIIEALAVNKSLVTTVTKFGWEKDAKKTLIDELSAKPDYLPTEWIDAVASFMDPETYTMLKDYLINGSNPSWTYQSIQRYIPELDLTDAVAAAWKRTDEQPNSWGKFAMLDIAMEYGQASAVKAAVDLLDDPDARDQSGLSNPRAALIRHTPARGSNDEIRAWYEANKDKLVFDKERKEFIVKEP